MKLGALTITVFAFYSKVRVLVMTLFFDVLFDDFVRHVPRTDAEVASRPHVPTPELLSQVRKLTHQLVRTLPFQHLQQTADRDSWRHAHEQMDVVTRHMPFDNGHFRSAADFADQFPESHADFPTHDGFTILRDPDNVQVDAENCVRAMPVFCHARTVSCRRKPAEAFA